MFKIEKYIIKVSVLLFLYLSICGCSLFFDKSVEINDTSNENIIKENVSKIQEATIFNEETLETTEAIEASETKEITGNEKHYKNEISTVNAFQIAQDMKIGWNLGNTLDSYDFRKTGINSVLKDKSPEVYYETLWHNPVTTNEMIKMVAEAGFGAIRIPVTYYDHFDDQFQIRKEWLDRIEQVVQYVLDAGLYCIINLHHEEVWLKAEMKNSETYEISIGKVWCQIAERFKSYNNMLLFEGFNEIRDTKKRWSSSSKSSYEALNKLNQKFVDVVRNSSGYNKERYLVLNTYAASADDDIIDAFQIPDDIIENHLIVQIHTYAPLEFTWTEKQVTWTNVYNNWTNKDVEEVDKIFKRLNERFVKNGIPIILGEFGAWNKNNTNERAKYARDLVTLAKKYNITCFWWDTGGNFKSVNEVNGSALLNRSDLTWYYPEIVNGLIEAAK